MPAKTERIQIRMTADMAKQVAELARLWRWSESEEPSPSAVVRRCIESVHRAEMANNPEYRAK